MTTIPARLLALSVLSLAPLVAASCSSNGPTGPVGGPVTGALDTHCGSGATMTVQTIGTCFTNAPPADPSMCGFDFAPDTGGGGDAGPPADDAGAPADDFGDTIYNDSGYDDDCKYQVSWTATPIRVNTNVTFTVTATRLDDTQPAMCAGIYPDVYLTDTHPGFGPSAGRARIGAGSLQGRADQVRRAGDLDRSLPSQRRVRGRAGLAARPRRLLHQRPRPQQPGRGRRLAPRRGRAPPVIRGGGPGAREPFEQDLALVLGERQRRVCRRHRAAQNPTVGRDLVGDDLVVGRERFAGLLPPRPVAGHADALNDGGDVDRVARHLAGTARRRLVRAAPRPRTAAGERQNQPARARQDPADPRAVPALHRHQCDTASSRANDPTARRATDIYLSAGCLARPGLSPRSRCSWAAPAAAVRPVAPRSRGAGDPAACKTCHPDALPRVVRAACTPTPPTTRSSAP